MKYSKYIMYIIFIILMVMILLSSTGCSSANLDNMRDPDLATGCVVVEYKLGFDSYLKTTQGGAEACKVKCSKELPDSFYYKYDNTRTGCHVVIGNKISEINVLSDVKRLSDI